MERRPEVGLDSYDRLFPNQDTLPQGGFGNLIALPLQKRSRELGNSVFLDGAFQPHSDQWTFLSTIRRIDRASVEEIVSGAERRGCVIDVRVAAPVEDNDAAPWAESPSGPRKKTTLSGPLPQQIELILGNQVYIAKDQTSP